MMSRLSLSLSSWLGLALVVLLGCASKPIADSSMTGPRSPTQVSADTATDERVATARSQPASRILDLQVGGSYACAVRADSSVWCWGHVPEWLLGRAANPLPPSPVPGLPGARRVFASRYGLCVAADTGGLYCLGPRWLRGPGVRDDQASMVWDESPDELHIREHFACGLLAGDAYCWGNGATPWWLGRARELPAERRTSVKPKRVHGLPGLRSLHTRRVGVCAIARTDDAGQHPSPGDADQGQRWCWGGSKVWRDDDPSIPERARQVPHETGVEGRFGPTAIATRAGERRSPDSNDSNDSVALGPGVTKVVRARRLYALRDGQVIHVKKNAAADSSKASAAVEFMPGLGAVEQLYGPPPSGSGDATPELMCALTRAEQIFCWPAGHPLMAYGVPAPDVRPAHARMFLGWIQMPALPAADTIVDTALVVAEGSPPTPPNRESAASASRNTTTSTAIVDLDVYRDKVCALRGDGESYCWAPGEESKPAHQDANPPFASWALTYQPCGIVNDGSGRVQCRSGGRSAPWKTIDLPPARQLSGALDHHCALHGDGTVSCFANGPMKGKISMILGLDHYQFDDSVRVVQVPGLDDATSVRAYPFGGCATRKRGGALCWHERYGHIDIRSGAQITQTAFDPSDGTLYAILGYESLAVATGRKQLLALDDHRSVMQTNFDRLTLTNTDDGRLSSFRELSFSSRHGCGISSDRRLHCWGHNESGQLGRGFFSPAGDSLASAPVPDIDNIVEVVVAEGTTCATDGRRVHCWGAINTRVLREPQPTRVAIDQPVIDFDLSGKNGLAVTRDGDLWVWGGAERHQPTALSMVNAIPVRRTTPARLRAIESDGKNTCALPVNGNAIVCWSPAARAPQRLALPRPARSIVQNGPRGLAILNDGSLMAWGARMDGYRAAEYLPPVVIPGVRQVKRVSLGSSHDCALTRAGAMYCWRAFTGRYDAKQVQVVQIRGLRRVRRVSGNRLGSSSRVHAELANGTVLDIPLVRAMRPLTRACDKDAAACRPMRVMTVCRRKGEIPGLPGCKPGQQKSSMTVTRSRIKSLQRGIYGCTRLDATTLKCGSRTVKYPAAIKKVLSTSDNRCVLAADRNLYCTGHYNDGQLGDGRSRFRTRPIEVSLPAPR